MTGTASTEPRPDAGPQEVAAGDGRPTYEVVWPKSAMGIQPQRSAPRLDSFDGSRIAFLWDYVFRGDELFPALERALLDRFHGVEIVGYQEFGNTHGADEKERIATLPQFLRDRHIDAVVSGMGC